MNWIVMNFLRGLVIVVPIALTLYLVYEAFLRIDRLIAFPTPGVGVAVMFLVVLVMAVLLFQNLRALMSGP